MLKSVPQTLLYDNIIYKLQKYGGISTYWQEITTRIINYTQFDIQHLSGNRLTRYIPIYAKANIFHSSYYRTNFYPKVKNIVTVYDFLYELGFLKTLGNQINIFQKKLAINRADVIICISANTKKDLLTFYPQCADSSHVYVVKLGTLFTVDKLVSLNVSKRLMSLNTTTSNRFILFVGSRVSYKNFQSALLGFAGSSLPHMGYYLVCTGSKFSSQEDKFITRLSLNQKVVAFENPTYTELNYLYQKAFALVYPSLYEGFGLPPLEAMSCGCPVVVSQTSSIPEVVGDAGIFINPYDVDSISKALNMILDENLRQGYIHKGLVRAKLFNWDSAVQKHLQIYQSLNK